MLSQMGAVRTLPDVVRAGPGARVLADQGRFGFALERVHAEASDHRVLRQTTPVTLAPGVFPIERPVEN